MIWRPFTRPLGDLTEQDLKGLITPDPVPEGLFVEYKRDWESKKVGRAACSFANSEGGGTIVVGIAAEKLVPTSVVGLPNDGTLEERVTNVIRTLVAPIPRYATRVISIGDQQRACIVIEVPTGFEPPYLFVGTGQIMIRTATSSEPVSIRDREALDRLYSTGRRGTEWATRRHSQIAREGLVDARRATVVAVPNVDGGLPVGGIVFASSMLDRLKERFTHWLVHPYSANESEDLDVSGDALTFTSGLARDERWVITTGVDGVVLAAIAPEPEVRLFSPTRLNDAAKQFLPKLVSLYRDVFKFEGTVSIAFHMHSTSGPIRTDLGPVRLGTEQVEDLVARAERAIDRSAGRFAWEPEPPDSG